MSTAVGFTIPNDDEEARKFFIKLNRWAEWYDRYLEAERRKRAVVRKRRHRKQRYAMRQRRRYRRT